MNLNEFRTEKNGLMARANMVREWMEQQHTERRQRTSIQFKMITTKTTTTTKNENVSGRAPRTPFTVPIISNSIEVVRRNQNEGKAHRCEWKKKKRKKFAERNLWTNWKRGEQEEKARKKKEKFMNILINTFLTKRYVVSGKPDGRNVVSHQIRFVCNNGQRWWRNGASRAKW